MKYQYNNKPNFRAKTTKCSCGGIAKLISKTNYPFGLKSRPVKSLFYRCSKCDKITFVIEDKQKKGRR
jgi:hypothetical protein